MMSMWSKYLKQLEQNGYQIPFSRLFYCPIAKTCPWILEFDDSKIINTVLETYQLAQGIYEKMVPNGCSTE